MYFELAVSIALGIGLAAACGFRVFLPLFVMSLLTHFNVGGVGAEAHFAWIGTLPSVIAFGVATLVEIFAYFIPFIDHLLDVVAVPLATVAGTLVAASSMMDLPPLLQWSVALIAGGGMAGLIKGAAAGTRIASTTSTAGFGNPLVALVETIGSLVLTLLSWFLPVLAIVVVGTLAWWVYRLAFKPRRAGPR